MHARLRTISRAILTISLAVGLCGCGTSVNVSAPGQAKGPVMSIGVPADEPGVGWYHDGEYSGLSVEVAKYVAKVLGYGDEQLFFHSQTPATRLDRLDDGSVDFAMVLSVGLPMPRNSRVIAHGNDHRGMEMTAHAGVRLFQRLCALQHKNTLGLFIVGGRGIAARLQNQIQLFPLYRTSVKFPQRIALRAELCKIHWDSSSFV